MPESFEKEVVSWFQDDGENQDQIYNASAVPLNPLRYDKIAEFWIHIAKHQTLIHKLSTKMQFWKIQAAKPDPIIYAVVN